MTYFEELETLDLSVNTVENIRKRTALDVFEKLKTYNKCLVARPTGFGKTTMMANILRDYNRVLYLYPADIIESTVKEKYWGDDGCIDDIRNVTFMTYMKVAVSGVADIENNSEFHGYDLIVCDEVHKIGAEKTCLGLSEIIKVNPKAQLIGLTATPIRSDGFDISSEFFDDVFTFPYTLSDAIEGGMIKKPYYCFCSYDLDKDIKESRLVTEAKLSDGAVERILKSKYIEQAKSIAEMPNIIKRVCDKYTHNGVDYMKFIVFYRDIESITSMGKTVKKWFKKAYPDHTIRTIEISSRNKKTKENVSKLANIKRRSNKKDIVLINCCDMLNMGYHVPDITGVVMMRGTHSGIIYSQQLGRALSSGNNYSSIVFDVVDNIHRKSMYEIINKSSLFSLVREKTILETDISALKLTSGNEKLISSKQVKLDEVIKRIEKIESNPKKQIIHTDKQKALADVNKLVGSNLQAVGYEATYRELIAKAVAESLTESCRRAFWNWMDAYIRRDGNKNLNGLLDESNNLDDSQVLEKFFNNTGIDLLTLKTFEQDFQNGSPTGIPISPFTKLHGVSVNILLDWLVEKYPSLAESSGERIAV